MRNLSFLLGVVLLLDVSPSGHVKSNESNMARIEQYSGMNVFVAVADGVKTVIVMEGDSVTLNTNVTEIKRDDTVLWMFGDDNSIIANMNEAAGIFSTKEDVRFGDSLELDKQTGFLTIRNIRTEHTGHYQLKIKSTTETTKRFSVTVRELPQSLDLKTIVVGLLLAVVVLILIISIGIGFCIWKKKCCFIASCPCYTSGGGGTDAGTDSMQPLKRDPQQLDS